MARLTRESARQVMNEYPQLKRALQQQTYGYKDVKIEFIKRMIRSIEYFQGISKTCLNEIAYKVLSNQKQYEPGQMIIKELESAD